MSAYRYRIWRSHITGGNSNLLLMNPAGIVFTQGASFNIPGSLTVTTADAIGFESGFFPATGNINYQNLLGAPNQFVFTGDNGSIVNAAEVELNQGNLALIGSSVINTGTLRTANGTITITAVPESSLPMAILHDGEQFLLEKYNVNLMPSISLTDTRYANIKNLKVLAMGASEFTDQNPLPAVPVELSTITEKLWQGQSFLNTTFTPQQLKTVRNQTPFGILHLATHGEFKSGKPENSYIQFWQTKLALDQIRELGLNNPVVELMVLSACRTASIRTNALFGANIRNIIDSLRSTPIP